MAAPAVPQYMNRHLSNVLTSPGHGFGLYFPVWRRPSWEMDKNNKRKALQQVLSLSSQKGLLSAIRNRQQNTAMSLGEKVCCFEALSTSPFLTGVGMEHPVENGFAFLTPYGLPYLAGSSVKGVLRRGAEELAIMESPKDSNGWNLLALWRLFGFEASAAGLGDTSGLPKVQEIKDIADERIKAFRKSFDTLDLDAVLSFMKDILSKQQLELYQKDPKEFLTSLIQDKKLRESISYKGALSFWDVYPVPAGETLDIDILNPHHGDYYQNGATPADCESPVPSFFLVMPAKSSFVFYVQCEVSRLPGELTGGRWHSLLDQAFTYAFDWLGFGAKTAVGYGQMRQIQKKGDTYAAGSGDESGKQTKPVFTPPARQVWKNAFLTYLPNTGEVIATFGTKKAGTKDKDLVPKSIAGKLFGKKKKAQATVVVEPEGNAFKLVEFKQ